MFPTNLDECKKLNFDVVMLPPTATNLLQQVRELHTSTGREATEFQTEVAGFKLTVLALKRAPGIVAPEMKRRKAEKTVREFIQEQ